MKKSNYSALTGQHSLKYERDTMNEGDIRTNFERASQWFELAKLQKDHPNMPFTARLERAEKFCKEKHNSLPRTYHSRGQGRNTAAPLLYAINYY
jgi:hypothetical protein